jgi:hypothetical protein
MGSALAWAVAVVVETDDQVDPWDEGGADRDAADRLSAAWRA